MQQEEEQAATEPQPHSYEKQTSTTDLATLSQQQPVADDTKLESEEEAVLTALQTNVREKVEQIEAAAARLSQQSNEVQATQPPQQLYQQE